MIRLWVALFLCLCGPAVAQAVRVTSGEHDGFTRLVFDYGQPVDWQLGRSPDGYELSLPKQSPQYDLTNAFALIGKSRLAAIWVAPETGELHIGLACACHAMPFEFRPGIIVVDLKDGPPPAGSSFELALDGSAADPLSPPSRLRPKRRPGSQTATEPPSSSGAYDWTADAYSALRTSAPPTAATPESAPPAILPPDPGLQPLRDTLVHQMARGAAQGVVEMAGADTQQTDLPKTRYPSAQIRIGEAPTSVNKADRSVQGDLGATGATCVSAAQLDISAWGDESLPMIDQLAASRLGLSGEFDKPDPEAVARAVRFQLFLGFGAEARQTLTAFDLPQSDAAIWRALSYLIDDGRDPETTFKGQAACAGPSALWALLGDTDLAKGDPVDKGSVRLAFAALPLHLRRLIGPGLAERLLALGDEDSARAVRDSIIRAPGEPGSAITLMEAEIDLHGGNAPASEHKADEVISDPGQNHPEALVALTEARIAQKLPVEATVALSLQALVSEHAGTSLEPRLQDALILAQAASGDFLSAFDGLNRHPNRAEDVWALLASLGTDQVFLTHAVLDPDQTAPTVQDETKISIARRLTGLGLAGSAQQWLVGVDSIDPMLLAETALVARDGHAVLIALGDTQGEVADGFRLRAYELLGQDQLAAEILSKGGDVLAASAAQARAGDWQALTKTNDSAWKALASQLSDTPKPAEGDGEQAQGLLAQGHSLAQAGSDTRDAVHALLATLPAPAPPADIDTQATANLPTN